MSLTVTALHTRRDARATAVAESLRVSLGGSNAMWLRAALRRAESDPLAAALDASVLASALALRAVRYLDDEMHLRDRDMGVVA